MELKGTTAVITGSSGRLGGSIAITLGKAGCNCICHYHSNKQRAEEITGQIRQAGGQARAVRADLTKPEQIEELFKKAGDLGTVQVLVNSAAVFSRGALAGVTFEEARKVFDMNLMAAILASKVFAKRITEKFGQTDKVVGKIINISGIGGIRPWAKYVLYCSSKAGLIGATKALAKELAPTICVNSVAPGMVTWPEGFSEEQKQKQLRLVPVGRIAKPAEVSAAVIFLLENDYMTGTVLNVDGGRGI